MQDGAEYIRHVQELALNLERTATLDDLYRGAVEGLLGPLGFDRAALFLYLPETNEMLGTYGTSPEGKLISEAWYRTSVSANQSHLLEVLAEPDRLKVWEDRELRNGDVIVGRGWNVMCVLQDGERTLGWLSLDNAVNHRPLSAMEREVLALYGRTLSSILQRKQFQELSEKYRKQNALKDRLFTILAHDLRGPIGNIGVMLGLALGQHLDPKDLNEILVESRDASVRTYNLLDNVLGWVRSQLEEVNALRERFALQRPMAAVQVWLNATAKAKDVSLVVDCHESLTVFSDERMVETIVRNLVSNAVKYSPPGATVLLRGRIDGGRVLFEIVDQGVGVPAEKLATLFSPEQKESRPGTTGEGGNGLGLMFSSDLAKVLGGTLEAESTVGKGSTFRLALPDELDGLLEDEI